MAKYLWMPYFGLYVKFVIIIYLFYARIFGVQDVLQMNNLDVAVFINKEQYLYVFRYFLMMAFLLPLLIFIVGLVFIVGWFLLVLIIEIRQMPTWIIMVLMEVVLMFVIFDYVYQLQAFYLCEKWGILVLILINIVVLEHFLNSLRFILI